MLGRVPFLPRNLDIKYVNFCKSSSWNKDAVLKVIDKLKKNLSLETIEDWNKITQKQLKLHDEENLLDKFSLLELKCMAFPEGKKYFTQNDKNNKYWENKENIDKFLLNLKEKYNLTSYKDWDKISRKEIRSIGGSGLLKYYSIYEIKCMGFPEGKLQFKNSKLQSGYWNDKNNIIQFLDNIREKYNLKTAKDWNSITTNQIRTLGGHTILQNYSIYELKCLGFPEGKELYDLPPKPIGYWDNMENVLHFCNELKEKLNLKTLKDWNSITQKEIRSQGGRTLLQKYSIFEIKCFAFPEGKEYFKSKNKSIGFWDDKKNVIQFLNDFKEKYNLVTLKDWNSISQSLIKAQGGSVLLQKYSLFDLKCLGFPEGKNYFGKQLKSKPLSFWNEKENIIQFLKDFKENFQLITVDDWNSITRQQIKDFGGSSLFHKYSLFDLKCLGFPDGCEYFKRQPTKLKPIGYWERKENVIQFLTEVEQKYNLQTFDDWNLISQKQIKSIHGGNSLLQKYSLFDLKCLGFPNGKFEKPNQYKPTGFWDDKNNVIQFLKEFKEKYNLINFDDWNSITQKQIQNYGGNSLLLTYSMYEIKCLGFPEGKDYFNPSPKSIGFWDDKKNVLQFINELKLNYNLQTPEDWNLLTRKKIQLLGGTSLLKKYSMYEIKCLGCPNGSLLFDKPFSQKPQGYWDNEDNRIQFINNLKENFNLNSNEDWNRLSRSQIISHGGDWLLKNKEYMKKLNFELSDKLPNPASLRKIETQKRSSQRWLFLQVQKLFPGEEIVEDYFHSELSRQSGSTVQFDVYLIHRNIAIEYHGKQHYEDIPSGFSPLEMYKKRDQEKEQLCLKYGIQLIIIPYWWDNKLDSLKETLNARLHAV